MDTWIPKQPEIVREIKKNMYVDDLISGGTTVPKAREMKDAATEIFADAGFELHKWHSNDPELESAETDRTADQTFAKQQLGTPSMGESSLLGLKWDKLRDFLSVTVSTEKADNTKRGILAKNRKDLRSTRSGISPHTIWQVATSWLLQPKNWLG